MQSQVTQSRVTQSAGFFAVFIAAVSARVGVGDFEQVKVRFPIRAALRSGAWRRKQTSTPRDHALVIDACGAHVFQIFAAGDGAPAECSVGDGLLQTREARSRLSLALTRYFIGSPESRLKRRDAHDYRRIRRRRQQNVPTMASIVSDAGSGSATGSKPCMTLSIQS